MAKFFHDTLACQVDAYRKFGPALVMSRLSPIRPTSRQYILVMGPEFNQTVLEDPAGYRTTGQFRNGPPQSSLRRIRNGLTAMNGVKHQQQRRLVIPFFAKKSIDGYVPKLCELTDQILSRWPVGAPVDISERAHQLLLRLSARILYGRENPDRMEQMGHTIDGCMKRNLNPLLMFFPLRYPGSPMNRLLRDARRVEQMLRETIAARRANPMPEGGDLLDHLIHARDTDDTSMTDADLLGQATILFSVSYETEAKAMIWSMLLMAQHPAVARRVSEEVDSVMGDGPPTVEQLERLPYLDAVIKESMRLLPPVPYLLRRATRNASLCGIPVRRGDWLVVSTYITHRMSHLFPEPGRFLPERWFTIKPSQFEYLPFGAGPRWCIGKQLAMTTLKLTLAMMVQRWSWQAVPGSRVDRLVRVTLGPRRALPMILTPQRAAFRSVPLRGNVAEMVDWSGESIPLSRAA